MTAHAGRTTKRSPVRRAAGGAALAIATLALSAAPALAQDPSPYWPEGNGPNGFIGIGMGGGASGPVTSVEYSMSVADGTPQSGHYHAIQQNFSASGVYYSGLQPADNNTIRALFSVFGPGTRPDSTNCHGGADGGAGTSCATVLPYNSNGPRQTFRFVITKDATNATENRWKATVRDEKGGTAKEVGAWWVDKNRGDLSNRLDGFVERFGKIKSCDQISATDTIVSNVKIGGATPTWGAAKTYGNCGANVAMGHSFANGTLRVWSDKGSPVPLPPGTTAQPPKTDAPSPGSSDLPATGSAG